MSFFLQLNTKEDILKIVVNQTVFDFPYPFNLTGKLTPYITVYMQTNLDTRIVFILFSMISMISVFSCIKEPKVAERQRKGTGKVIKYTTCKFHAAV